MSNPNQEIIESRLATYIDGELEDNERLEIEQHLQQNPQYRKVIDDLRKQRDLLRGLPREAAPLDLAEAFTNQLERAELLNPQTGTNRDRPMRINALSRLMAAAAVVLLTLGLGVIVYIVLPDRNVRKVSIAPITPKGFAPADTEPSDGIVEEKSSLGLGDNTALAMKSPGDRSPGGISPADKSPDEKTSLPPSDPLSPEAAAKPAAIGGRKDVLRDSREAFLLAQNRPMPEEALRQEARDAELDRLAESVSKDPQVKALLGESDEKRGTALGAAPLPENARVMVVRVNDPKRVEQELAKLFGRDNVDWRPAPRPVELALNTSLSQQSNEALQSNGMANKREIDSAAVESEQLKETEKQAGPVKAAAPPARPGSAPQGQQQGLGQSRGQSAANLGAKLEKDTGAQGRAPELPAGETLNDGYRVDKAKDGRELYSLKGSAIRRDVQETLQATPNVADQSRAMTANATPVQSLYVVRRLSPSQMAELSACLAQNGDVRNAGETRQLGEYRYAGNFSAAAPNTTTAADSAAPPSAAAPDVLGGSNALHDAVEQHAGIDAKGSADRGSIQPAESAIAPAAAPAPAPAPASAEGMDVIVHKGDSLRVHYGTDKKAGEQSQMVKVQEDGTIAPRGKPVQVAGKTLDDVKKALEQSQPAAAAAGAAPPAVSVERVGTPSFAFDHDHPGGAAVFGQPANQARAQGADRPADEFLKRRAATDAPANPAATQPLADLDATAGTVDVVIVVQTQPGLADTIAAPVPVPSAKPAASAVPALPAAPSPTTRPATPAK